MMKPVLIRLTGQQYQRLNDIADGRDIPLAEVIRQCIEKQLPLAEAALKQYQSTIAPKTDL